MSAAAPAPPPHLYPVSSSTEYRQHPGSMASNNSSGAGGSASNLPNGSHPSSRPLPHIADLVAKAEKRVNEERQRSIQKLLQLAETCLRQAQFFYDMGRIDSAYTEYVVAYQLVTDAIPRSREYPTMSAHVHHANLHKTLTKNLNTLEERYTLVRDTIKANNQKSGMTPSIPMAVASQPQHADTRPSSMQPPSSFRGGPNTGASHVRNSYSTSSGDSTPPSPSRPAPRPPLNPRTQSAQSLHLTDIVPQNPLQNNPLASRFAKLRVTPRVVGEAPNGAADPASAQHSRTSSTSSYAPRKDAPALHMQLPEAPTQTRDSQASSVARNTAHISVNTNLSKELPKPPSPTYTPTRSMQSGAAFEPPRSSRTNTMPTSNSYERPPSAASQSSLTNRSAQWSNPTSAPVRMDDTGEAFGAARRRRKSVNRPLETEVSAQKLFDYLESFDVLLIDVRSREEYDQGHIFARSGMCIEPAALRPNMSADQLQDSLVLSPESEQKFFSTREKFELVVYFDQSTDAKSFASGRGPRVNPALKYLFEALYDYNQDKPLNYPPILLDGGLDAWIDLLGSQALQTSNTLSRQQEIRPEIHTPSSKIDVHKRRHRDYNPLSPEEAEKWRQRARSESIILDAHTPSQDRTDGSGLEIDERYAQTFDDFAKRYPDVASVEEQARRMPVPPPKAPLPIPTYPTPPPRSAPPVPAERPVPEYVPPVPARPPPTVSRPSYGGVSDRTASHSTTTTTKPQQLVPYIPQRLKRLPRTGLANFGATCYMNSTLQCLSGTVQMTAYFLDDHYRRHVQRDTWKGSKGLMPDFFQVLLRNLWETNNVDTIRPTNFRELCSRIRKDWGSSEQQDAKEFLDFLMDCLHEDLNNHWRRNPLRPLTDEEEARRERIPPFIAAKREWNRYVHRDFSRLTELFAGQHMSRLQCTTCHHTSTTYETFYSISVEIPKATSPRDVHISDCLRSYCSNETLSGSDTWFCPRCKRERETTKRITITRAPDYLIIHFKRFSAGHSEKARKIHTPVDFPLKGLNLAPFMLPPPDPRDKEQIMANFSGEDLEAPASMVPPYKYNAYAVMRHIGQTMTSGHYISLVEDRARSCWRQFDDARSSDFQPDKLPKSKRLQNEQAYIVFFRRLQPGEEGAW